MERAQTSADDYRYERKFVVSELTKHEIELLIRLHPAIFSEIYHERFVNNLYLDSFDLKNYFESVDGSSDRVKVRIRWYGDLFGAIENPVLELKIKTGLLGRKERFPLVGFSMDESFQMETIADVFARSDIPESLRLELISSEVALLNRYRRRYFESADRKCRLTLDSQMEFYKIRRWGNTFAHESIDYANIVVELKYEQMNDEDVRRIVSSLPFRMTKSSKYVSGIEGTFWG